jgi:hypothetical protein
MLGNVAITNPGLVARPHSETGMPMAYLDVPSGADLRTKQTLVKALYEALNEAYPFPDDTRIFLREWPGETCARTDSSIQNRSGRCSPFMPTRVSMKFAPAPHGGPIPDPSVPRQHQGSTELSAAN